MPTHYEAIRAPRFSITTRDGREQIVIPAERSLFTVLFLSVWLCGWSYGGWSTLQSLMTKGAQSFEVIWLIGWTLGEAFAITTVAWMLTGAETLRIIGNDLELGYRILGVNRAKLFRGTEIQRLSSSPTLTVLAYRNQLSVPFLGGNKTGALRFDYGPRTIYVGPGLDEAEGRLLADHLRKWLPASASRPDP